MKKSFLLAFICLLASIASFATSPITGTLTVCAGSTTTLSDATTGGFWYSSVTSVATIGSATGIVTGVAAGTATISYYVPASGLVTAVVTVNPVPTPITGTMTVCTGMTTTLMDAVPGGTWISSNPTVAAVGVATGIVSGIAAGTATIYYQLATSCATYTTVTVYPLPAPISGTTSLCVGGTTTLADATPGGAWSSANLVVASVSSAGVLTGISVGTATISYTLSTGCSMSVFVTVNALPAPITGSNTVCIGSTITLSSTPVGGMWTSSSTGVATVGATSGVVTGVAIGATTITYSLGSGCNTYKTVTVTAATASITGPSTVCIGSSITLADATGGGTWSSGNPSLATVGSTSGVVTGVAAGTLNIYYSVAGCGGAYHTVTVTAAPAAITGPTSVCVGSTITLTDASTSGGWTWTSGTPSVATINATSGVVTGIAAGVTTITYTNGGCFVTRTVSVSTSAPAISGPSTVCVGSTITLTDAATGGTWTSGNPSLATVGITSGVVTGVATGVLNIYYSVGGCATYKTVTVTGAPSAISGPGTVCIGGTITLTNTTSGGSWISSNTTRATVGSSTGVVTGVSAGTVTIYYSVPGCGGAYKIVTVNAAPAPITGPTSVCVGSTITLSDASTSGGWTWTSSTPSVATINATSGVVTGIAVGVTTITYTNGGCFVTRTVSVSTSAPAISGPSTVCVGSTITLTDAATGGTWSSGNPSLATVGSGTGVVTGVAAGVLNIYYSVGGCATYKTVTVTATPSAISGPGTVCVGSTVTLADATAGGSWSSSNTTRATVGATSGVVTGVSAGTVTIYYLIPGCGGVYKIMTINAAPAAITGPSTVCVGSTITLSDASTSGGWTWSSSNPSVASINATSGVVTGVSVGVVTITYTNSGCHVTKSVSVSASGPAISGPSTVCVGSTITLTDSASGGTWTSGNTSLATVGATTGIVTGVAVGVLNIYYSVGGCATYKTVSVTAATASITGPSTLCVGSTITLADATAGGTWSSSGTTVVTVGSTGIVTGISAGTANIYYIVPGCGGAYKIVTVNAAPAAISGSSTVCAGSTTTLTDATPGGTWSSSGTGVATVGSASGVVTGVAAGVTTITYTVGTSCSVTKLVTVTGAPSAISGPGTVCIGGTITLTDATAGGSWISSNTTRATVGSSTGIVTGVSAGTVTIYYSTGCGGTYKIITVNAAPAVISGSNTVCIGSSITLTDATTGGSWSSGNTAVATIGSATGVVTGVATGVVNIYYTAGGCSTYKTVTVTSSASSITGSGTVCVGSTISLSDATSGGTWSTSNTSVATVGSGTGIVTGVSAGTVNVYYLAGGCGAYKIITVNPAPAAIAGSSTLCVGSTTTLTDATPGGSWSSGSPAIATVGASTGVVTGVSAGIVYITYTVAGCSTYKKITISTCTGTIAGKAAGGGAKGTSGGIPVVGLLVKMKDASNNATINQTYTNASGMYSFTSVADGAYYIYPEDAGYTTTPSATITISGTADNFPNVNFTVSEGSKTITPNTTIVNSLSGNEGIRIYPNPTSGILNISWENQLMGNATITVTDMIGREVSHSVISNNNTTGETRLGLSELKDGIYLVTIKSETINYNARISIRH